MAVTMKDIARGLGVSVVTVSKVLRNHSDISAATRERVLKRMKELNYQPNQAARTLLSGRSNLIGLIVPDLVHPFFSQVAKGISAQLRTQDYGLIIASSENEADLENLEIEQMMARRVDALILASTQSDVKMFQKIKDSEIPYVLLDRKINGLEANFVGVDDKMVGVLATTHLLELGCKTIAHIGGSGVSTAIDRQVGYSMTLAKHGIRLKGDYIRKYSKSDDSGDEGGYIAMHALLQISPRPDGVFCYNDPIALGAMRSILDAGLQIPEDIAVVGCGNVHYADFLRVPLSSVDQNSKALGSRAAKLALNIIKNKSADPPKNVMLPAKLVVRASSRRQPG